MAEPSRVAAAAASGAVAPRAALPRRRRHSHLTHYLLLAPAILLSMAIVLLPGIFTAATSLTDWDGVSTSPAFVGLDNYVELFTDPVFRTALKNNIIWTLLFVSIPVVLGLGVAMLLLKRPRTRALYQVIFLLPYVMAAITNAIVWLNMIYSPISGIVGFLNKHGIGIDSPLASTDWAIYAVAAVDMWHYWGFLLVVYLAALRQTPIDQVEAAQLEGANSWQVFRYVYLPSIKPTLQLMFVMITIFSFLTFDYIFLMTQGGPANSTEILSTVAYSMAFATFQFGKAAAVGIVMGLFGLVAAVLYTRLSRRGMDV
ncbi:ABC transporter permease subunit [Pseudactinotalea sp. HY160]|uniref:carbohydrate ABC transporter permease n=1 Tax=Pseudactinotalea sp. HY160 TaxID=2654490 RepID=UPI00128D4115|nr:sugar ABC transporter permease [Pseudactinotalea sp. HY160]MPV50678.1 ABC transporter permease subunit [Pseudactinotalea sp. HY160]